MMKKVQVWVVSGHKVLLLRVIEKRGGNWHPITANLEKGESLLRCAKRETLEETGIKERKGKWLSLDFSFEYHGRWGHAIEHVYALVLKEHPLELKMDPSEHTEYCWVSFAEAKKRLKFKLQKDALQLLIKVMKKRLPEN